MSGWLKIALFVLLLTLSPVRAQEVRVVLVAPPGPAADKALLEVARQLPKVTFISSHDPDILALARVPFSSRPLLAMGRFSPEGRLEALTWQSTAATPRDAIAELTAHLQDQATRPRLQGASLTPGTLREGETLLVRAAGTPSSEVRYQLGSRPALPMQEERPGFYVARYQVQATDNGELPVRVDLTNARGSASIEAGLARLEGVAPPLVDDLRQVGTRRWILYGLTAPNARVTGTLWLEGRERRLDTKSDASGRFSQEITTRRFLESGQGELSLTTTTEDGVKTQSIRFVGDETFRPVRVPAFGGFGWGAPWGWGGWPGAWGGCGPWGPWNGGWGW